MKDQILARGKKVWGNFQAFTPGQKAVTITAVLAIVIGGLMFSKWSNKTTYAPLYTNLAPADASAIVDKLNASKTPYQLAAGGAEILVPSKDVYTLRLQMSSANLPSSGSSGYSLLDKEGITTSQFKQNVDYQRAIEGELANTIKSISGVTDAQVHLAIPQDTVFTDNTSKPTASVLLTLQPGSQVTDDQVRSVANLVSSAVTGMSSNDVSISDSAGDVLKQAGSSEITTGGIGSTDKKSLALAQQYEASIQSVLEKFTGVGNAQVTVTPVLNNNSTNSTTHTVTGQSGVPLVNNYDNESYGGAASAAASGVAGATSPSPTVTTTVNANGSPIAGAGGSGYNHSVGNITNGYVDNTTQTTVAPGAVESLHVAVAIDSKATQIPVAQLQQLIQNAIPFDAKRGDKITVLSGVFNNSAAQQAAAAAAKQAKAAAAAKSKAALMGMVKQGALVLLVGLVILFIWLANRKKKKPEGPDELDLFLSQLNDSPDTLPAAPADIVRPKSSANQMTETRQRQLAELAEDDPQEVARLLRNWLNAKEG